MEKLLLPLLAALLIGQFFLLIRPLWFSSWIIWFFLVIISFLADIIEQARKFEAPILINILFAFIVYLATNLILIKQKNLSLTASNLFYQKEEMVTCYMALLAIGWGMSHGYMLSSVRAYWSFDTKVLSAQREEAFSPPAMVLAIKRCLFLGFIEHLLSWYYKLPFHHLLLFWALAFSYLGLIQLWGLSLNIKSIGLSISSNIKPLWERSLLVFLVLIIVLSVLMPRNILTIKEERLSEGIVNLLKKIHERQSENVQERANIITPITGADETSLEGTYFRDKPNLTGWLFIVFFLVQLIIVVLVPALFIMGFIGWLLYSLLKSEYNRLEGLPRFFVRIYLWCKQLLQFQIKREKKAAKVMLKDELQQVKITHKLKKLRKGNVYQRLIKICQAQGLMFRKCQTPFEYSTQIANNWPKIGDKADEITEYYVAKKYGKRKFNYTKTRICHAHLKHINEFFRTTSEENTHRRQEIPRL